MQRKRQNKSCHLQKRCSLFRFWSVCVCVCVSISGKRTILTWCRWWGRGLVGGSCIILSGCLTCKAGLGAHGMGIERRLFPGSEAPGTGTFLCCFVLGCRPCHPQAWIIDKECFKPWGGVRIRFVALCFLFLSALYRSFGDRWLLGADPPLHALLELN